MNKEFLEAPIKIGGKNDVFSTFLKKKNDISLQPKEQKIQIEEVEEINEPEIQIEEVENGEEVNETKSDTHTHIMIATPFYGGMLNDTYLASMLSLQKVFINHGIDYTFRFIGNESLITRARNYFISLFMANPHFTHMLFVDSDIGFDPNSVIRMIQSGKEVVCGAYPKKGIMWNRIRNVVSSTKDDKDIEPRMYDYAINLHTQNASKITLRVEDDFIETAYAATGFLLIKREVVEAMIKAYPETKYTNDIAGYGDKGNAEYFYDLFATMICPDTNRYLSEDYTFSYRWLKMGGHIWTDLHCKLSHTGSYKFNGSYYDSFKHTIISRD